MCTVCAAVEFTFGKECYKRSRISPPPPSHTYTTIVSFLSSSSLLFPTLPPRDVFSFLPWNEITTATLALQLRPTTWEQFPVAGFPYLTPNNKDQTMRHEAHK